MNHLYEGDNLDVMTRLLPVYTGKVKVVYTDPPYNTGNKYRFGDDIKNWASFMRPRLELVHQFLSPDGAIFISIDDSELYTLGNLLDSIFGIKNRVANIIWQKKYGVQNDARYFSKSHEYILCYAKDISKFKIKKLARTAAMDARYKNPDEDRRGPWKVSDFSVRTASARYVYEIELPSGRRVSPPYSRSWMTSKERFLEMVADNRIWFGVQGNAKPSKKIFLSEVDGLVPSTLWKYDEVGHTDSAKRELKDILGDADFEAAKPVGLIKRCIELVAGEDDLVMDIFVGTGTTGHAVLELNKKSGNREFILIESGNGDDDYCRTLTAERLRRVISGDWSAGAREGFGGEFELHLRMLSDI